MAIIDNLPEKIEKAELDIQSDTVNTSYEFKISDENLDIKPVFWGSSKDVALSGNKRSNFRGWDLIVRFNYEAVIDVENIADMLDDMGKALLEDGTLLLRYSADYTYETEVIPTDETILRLSYSNQVKKGSGMPTLVFESDEQKDSIQDFF